VQLGLRPGRLWHPRRMHTAVYWFGFLGAWLLFAGPVFLALGSIGNGAERQRRIQDWRVAA